MYFQKDAYAALADVNPSPLDGARILMTGASGVVGLHLAAAFRHLINEGCNFSLHVTFQKRVEGVVASMLDHPKITTSHGDLTDSSFRRGLDKADFIIHGAGYGQPGRFLEHPFKTIRLNTEATVDLLEKLDPSGRFLFLSTSELYSGNPHPRANREEQIGYTNTDHPRSCYIESKRCGEAVCHAARLQGSTAISARLALAYGPGAKASDRRVLYTFIEKALHRGQIDLLDAGDAKRTYCYSADAARMMLNILLRGTQSVYNIGGQSSVLIRELAEIIGNILRVPVNLPKQSAPLQGAPPEVVVDTTRYQSEFGKINYTALEDGLKRTIAWHQEGHSQTQ